MNDDVDRAGRGADRDERRVEDFFAAHRRAVVEQQADEQTWEAIRVSAGRPRRDGRGLWFLGGVVAAAAAATTAFLLAGQGLGGDVAEAPPASTPTDQVVATSAAVPSATEEPTAAETTDDDATTTDEEPGAVDDGNGPQDPFSPGTFSLPAPDLSVPLLSVDEPSGSEGPLRTAVATVSCALTGAMGPGETFCPELAVSEDEGRTWDRRVDMMAAGYHKAVSARDSTWMWPDPYDWRDSVEPVSRLVRSDDGGRSWTAIPTRGEKVLAVETFRSTLVVVTQGCEGRTGESCVELVVTEVTTDDVSTGRRIARVDLPETFVHVPGSVGSSHRLMATYDAVYLDVGALGAYRLADGEDVVTRVDPSGCRVTAAPESQDSLVALCLADTGLPSVRRSADGGTTWAEVEAPPGLRETPVVSNNGTRLLAATMEGVWVTEDDGRTWEQTLDWASRGGPGIPEWITAVGGQELLAGDMNRQHEHTPLGRWVSSDDGRTWTEQPKVLIPNSR
ncbi:MAG TPA: hypothetical protein DD664_05955 [Janibacter terrae]|nr:hypothetical protein [Janibacter terrae]